jgi:integrase
MRGRIFSDQKCSICNASFQHEDRRRGLFCPAHPEQKATTRFIVQFGRKVRRRFSNYDQAERFLDGMRYEVDRGTFDYKDYLSSNPLSFIVLSNQYIDKKNTKLKPSTLVRLKGMFKVAQNYFKDTNVKCIQYAQLEDFIESLTVGNKTKSNYLSCLRDFFRWLVKRKEIDRNQFPDFPEISFELGFRKTIDKETQAEILNEVKRISYHVSPKIWLGIKWLSTYISIRPAEMRNLKEGHIDLKQGFFFIPHPKEKRPKIVPLIKEDLDILKKLPVGMPDLYFFRHGSGVSGCKSGERFGHKAFYKWWKKACGNLGIEGVDLYGGTRHSSAVGLREHATPEQIRRATMHSTNKAFERYFLVSRDELQDMYQATQCDTGVIQKQKENK